MVNNQAIQSGSSYQMISAVPEFKSAFKIGRVEAGRECRAAIGPGKQMQPMRGGIL